MNDFIKICRLCARKNIELTNMKDKESDDDISYYDMMLTCVPNLISEDDQLSTLICIECQEHLIDTYGLIDKWMEARKVLNKYKKQMNFTFYTDNDTYIHTNTNSYNNINDLITSVVSKDKVSNNSYYDHTYGTTNSKEFLKRVMADTILPKNYIEKKSTSLTNCDFSKVYSAIKANKRSTYTLVDLEQPDKTVYFNADDETKKYVCLSCSKYFKSVTYLFIHLVNHKQIQKFNCKKCFKVFQYEALLKNHEERLCAFDVKPINLNVDKIPKINITFEPGKNASCEPKINATFETDLNIEPGLSVVEQEVITEPELPIITTQIDNKTGVSYTYDRSIQFYTCSICDAKIKTLFSLRKHLRQHRDGKQYFCVVCNNGFKYEKNLEEHKLSHCEFYDKTLAPLRNKPGVKDNFICETCGVIMKDRCNFNQHVKRHSDERPFVCEICGKRFKLASVLGSHKHSHSVESKFQCTICPSKFRYRETLRTHLQRHAGIKPYKCEVCGKAFVRKDNMQKHRNTHIDIDSSILKCPICGITYKTSYRLKAHMYVHSTVKEFNCEVCDRGFLYEHTLRFHMRKHTSVKPYNCHICAKGFLVEHRLKRHLRQHARNNVFSETQFISNDAQSQPSDADGPLVLDYPDTRLEDVDFDKSDNSDKQLTPDLTYNRSLPMIF